MLFYMWLTHEWHNMSFGKIFHALMWLALLLCFLLFNNFYKCGPLYSIESCVWSISFSLYLHLLLYLIVALEVSLFSPFLLLLILHSATISTSSLCTSLFFSYSYPFLLCFFVGINIILAVVCFLSLLSSFPSSSCATYCIEEWRSESCAVNVSSWKCTTFSKFRFFVRCCWQC